MRVTLDGNGGIAVLLARPHGRDQVAQPGVPRQGRHCLQQNAGQAPALVARHDLGGQGTDRGGLAPRCPQFEGGGDGRVDARAQAGVGAVPGDRDGVALSQDHRIRGVVEDELPLGEDVIELTPVMIERLPMPVVLRPDLARQAADGIPELWPLAVADNLRFHPASIPPPGAVPLADPVLGLDLVWDVVGEALGGVEQSSSAPAVGEAEVPVRVVGSTGTHSTVSQFAGFPQTETCWRLSLVKDSRVQPSHRSRSRNPASWAIRSSSAGHTYRNGIVLYSRWPSTIST